jgi:hypothetical protein
VYSIARLHGSLVVSAQDYLRNGIQHQWYLPLKEEIMKTSLGILATFVLASLSTACSGDIGPIELIRGSGNVVSEGREVSGFTAVTLDGVGQLVIDQTGSESLTITADDNFLPHIETRVSGNMLIIGIEDNTTFSDVSELTYHVTAADLEGLELNGAGDVTVNNLTGEDWSVDLNGTGRITVSGEVTGQTVEINGAGSYDAAGLKSQEATVKHSGAGTAVVQVSTLLDVTISGLGSVEYIGDPEVREEVSGLGAVRQQ